MKLRIKLLSLLTGAVITAAQYDVIVVGGGFSGLTAAKNLKDAGKNVVILEARNRTGGRVCNAPVANGGYTEVGAEFVGPTQDRVLAMIKELGLSTFETYNKGNNIYYENGIRKPYSPTDPLLMGLPPTDPISLAELAALLLEIDNMAKQVNPAQPWTAPQATNWDSQTFATWLSTRAITPGAQKLVRLFTNTVLSAETSELSLLYVVGYIAAAGNSTTQGTIERLINTSGGGQQSRVRGGTQMISNKLAESIGSSRILLNTAVRQINQSSSGSYTVVSGSGKTYSANDIVVAMSPPLAGRIIYSPPLPALRDKLSQTMPIGAIGKAIAIYKTPFWRAAGLTGQAISDSGLGRATFDSSPEDGSFGAMLTFIEADEMRAVDDVSPDVIKNRIKTDLVNYFGPQAADVEEWVIQRWDNEEFSRGGPTAIAPPSVLIHYGPQLTQKVGHLHFAGTESANYWIGYMDGAIRSGERVAKEILQV